MNYERDEEMKLTEYLSLFFVWLLGLFNSSKLEVRQITNTNAELLFQNGQIISVTPMGICVVGVMGSLINNRHYKYEEEIIKEEIIEETPKGEEEEWKEKKSQNG